MSTPHMPGSRIRLWSSLLPAALILSACGGGSPVAMDPDIESDVVSLVAGGGCADGTNSSGVASAITLDGSGVYSENFDGLGSGLPLGWSVCVGAGNLSAANSGALGTNALIGTDAFNFRPNPANWPTNRYSNFASVVGLSADSSNATQQAAPNRALGIRTQEFGNAYVFKLENTQGFQDFRVSLQAQTPQVRRRIVTWGIEYRVGESGPFTSLGEYRTEDFGSTTLDLCNLEPIGDDINDQLAPVFFRIRPVGRIDRSPDFSPNGASSFAIDNFQLTYRSIPSGRPLRPLRPINCAVRPTRPTR